jgi:hypothetical protein
MEAEVLDMMSSPQWDGRAPTAAGAGMAAVLELPLKVLRLAGAEVVVGRGAPVV